MKKVVENFSVIKNDALNPLNHCITLQSDKPLLPVFPGQFTNVEIPNNKDIFLRRPFSIFETDDANRTLSIIVKVLGRGSLTLSKVKPGDIVSLIYPLGTGFTIPSRDQKILAFGGGSGIAPILHLLKHSDTLPGYAHVILGAKNAAEHLLSLDHYDRYATFHYTTDDGTFGFRGYATRHPLAGSLGEFDRVYACGPLPMMKAVASLAKSAGVFCEVSLENLMACGFGVCLCCIEPTVKGNLCVCTEGPVFNVNELKW